MSNENNDSYSYPDAKDVFLVVLVVFAIWICIICCFVASYKKKISASQLQQERQIALDAAEAYRRRRRRLGSRLVQDEDYSSDDDDDDDEIYDNEEEEVEDPVALKMRLDQVLKALQVETLTLPSPPPEDYYNARTKTHPDSCQSCNEKGHDGGDIEQNVTSSSSLPGGGSDGTDTVVTSILEMLVSQWWKSPSSMEDDDNPNNHCCCICLDPYQPDQTICSPKCSDCNHIFHEHCAIPWFQKHDECPMCRTNILQSIVLVKDNDEKDEDSSDKASSSSTPLAAVIA